MKCKDCSACHKGYFKSQPDKYVCTGVPEPFVIHDINRYCTEYPERHEETGLWSWSKDDDDWSNGTFNSREEAIENALDNLWWIKTYLRTDNPAIFLGECEYIPLRTDLDPDRCMEYCDEMYADDSGCDYYIYEGITDEDKQWLEDKLSDVMQEFNERIGLKPSLFRVVATEEIDLEKYIKENK